MTTPLQPDWEERLARIAGEVEFLHGVPVRMPEKTIKALSGLISQLREEANPLGVKIVGIHKGIRLADGRAFDEGISDDEGNLYVKVLTPENIRKEQLSKNGEDTGGQDKKD